jgi:holo-[acyl-carrier protein] synthase
MEVIGHGIDVVELERFERLLSEDEDDFLSRCFTPAEQSKAGAGAISKRHETLAGNFAAKEAVAKALGSGFDGSIGPLDIEIANDVTGAPQVILHDAALALAGTLGISTWRLSISHAGPIAVASVLALKV